MSASWTPVSIGRAIAGHWLRPPASARAPVRGFAIDSRALRPGDAFFAIRGGARDGHAFLEHAAARGASLLIVERAGDEPDGIPVLQVPDTLGALARLAAAHRAALETAGVRVIAVGGANGKTTTRRLIQRVLASRGRARQSPHNFNNALGVPLTLLETAPEDDYLVAEVGTNHPGEVAPLARLLRPHVAVVGSLGREHLGAFDDLAGVAAEESDLLAALEPHGLAVTMTQWADGAALALPREWLAKAPADARHERLGDGPEATWRATIEDRGLPQRIRVAPGPAGPAFRSSVSVRLPLLGPHQRVAALPAAAVAAWAGIPPEDAASALEAAEPATGRMQPLRNGDGVTWIHDAYNANPESVARAAETLAGLTGRGEKWLVLGDMHELGGHSPRLHAGLAESLAPLAPPEGGIDRIVLVGPAVGRDLAPALRRHWPVRALECAASVVEAAERGAVGATAGDIVLLKASRGMGLESLLPETARPVDATRLGA